MKDEIFQEILEFPSILFQFLFIIIYLIKYLLQMQYKKSNAASFKI